MTLQEPYVIYGTFYDSNNTVLASTELLVTNETTGETRTVTTNGSGQYAFDCANFASGYDRGASIIFEVNSTPVWEHWASIDAGKNWQQVEYNTNTLMVYNTVRFKHSSTYYPHGRTFNVIKSA